MNKRTYLIGLVKKNIYLINKFTKKIPLLIFCIVIISILDAFSIGILFPVIKKIQDEEYLKHTFGYNSNLKLIVGLIIFLLVFFYLIKNFISILFNKILMKQIFNIYSNMSIYFVDNILRRKYLFFISTSSSELIKKIDYNIEYVIYYSIIPLLNLISDLFLLLFTVILLIYIEPFISTFLIVYIIFFILIYFKFIKNKSKNIGSIIKKESANNLKILQEILNNIKIIKLTHTEVFFTEKFKIQKNKLSAILEKNQIIANYPKIVIETVFISGFLFTYFLLYLEYNQKQTSILPIITIIGAASIRLIPLLNRFIYSMQSIYNTSSFTESLYNDSLNEENQENEIHLKGVSYQYPNNDAKILNEINLRIKSGEHIAIIGKSGSGKTTLINLILGLLNPTQGAILYKNNNISENLIKWQNEISYSDQNYYLIDENIFSNIAFGQIEYKIQDVEYSLKNADLNNFIDNKTFYFDSIGENGNKLSGGQKQRLSLARAFYFNKNILILDEPTSALHKNSENKIFDYLSKFKKNKTLIVITHNIDNLTNFDRVYSLENGQLIIVK